VPRAIRAEKGRDSRQGSKRDSGSKKTTIRGIFGRPDASYRKPPVDAVFALLSGWPLRQPTAARGSAHSRSPGTWSMIQA
jgi:hypothetical protein